MRETYSSMFQVRKAGSSQMLVPAFEDRIEIGMVPAELFPQLGRPVGVPRLGDAAHREILDHDVRGHCDHAGDRTARPAGVDQRDRGSAAVSEQYRARHAHPVQQFGKGDLRLVVHEADAMRRGQAVGSVRDRCANTRAHYRRWRGRPYPGSPSTSRSSRVPRAGTRSSERPPPVPIIAHSTRPDRRVTKRTRVPARCDRASADAHNPSQRAMMLRCISDVPE